MFVLKSRVFQCALTFGVFVYINYLRLSVYTVFYSTVHGIVSDD